MILEPNKPLIPIGTIHPLYINVGVNLNGNITQQSSFKLIDTTADFITDDVKVGDRIKAYIEDTTQHRDDGTNVYRNWIYYLSSDSTKGIYIGDIQIVASSSQNICQLFKIKFYYDDGTNDEIRYLCSNSIINAPKNKKIWKLELMVDSCHNDTQGHYSQVTNLKLGIGMGIVTKVVDSNILEINNDLFNDINWDNAPNTNIKYVIYNHYELNEEYEYCDGQICDRGLLKEKQLPNLNIGNCYLLGNAISGNYKGCNFHNHDLSATASGGANYYPCRQATAEHTHRTLSEDNRPETYKTTYIIKVL